jgi:hypothetical protein
LCRRELLEDILYDADGYGCFQAFVGVAAGVRGYRFAEVDTELDPGHASATGKRTGVDEFPVTPPLRVLREIARYRLATFGVTKRR